MPKAVKFKRTAPSAPYISRASGAATWRQGSSVSAGSVAPAPRAEFARFDHITEAYSRQRFILEHEHNYRVRAEFIKALEDDIRHAEEALDAIHERGPGEDPAAHWAEQAAAEKVRSGALGAYRRRDYLYLEFRYGPSQF